MYQTGPNVRLQPAEIAGGVLVTEFQHIHALAARFVAPMAMRDLLASEKMVLDPSALQSVPLHGDDTLSPVVSSDSCLIRWETYGIRNRLAVQKYVGVRLTACTKQMRRGSQFFCRSSPRLEGSGNNQQLSTPRYFNINVPTEFQVLSSHVLSDGAHAVLTYATPLKPVNVYSFNCTTYSMCGVFCAARACILFLKALFVSLL